MQSQRGRRVKNCPLVYCSIALFSSKYFGLRQVRFAQLGIQKVPVVCRRPPMKLHTFIPNFHFYCLLLVRRTTGGTFKPHTV